MPQHRYHQFVVAPDSTKDRVVVILDTGASTYYLYDDLSVIDSIAYLLQKPAVFFMLPAYSFAVVDVFKKTDGDCKKSCGTEAETKTDEDAVIEPLFVFNYEVFNSWSLFEPDEVMKKLIESKQCDTELESTIAIKYAFAPSTCPVEDCPTTVHYKPCYIGMVGACDKEKREPGCVAGGG